MSKQNILDAVAYFYWTPIVGNESDESANFIRSYSKSISSGNVDFVKQKKNLKKIYRKASMKLHPNKGGNTNNFQELQRHYETLNTHFNSRMSAPKAKTRKTTPKPKQNKPCPSNKIRNPKTKRCVLRSGKIGQKLSGNNQTSQKDCPPNKIRNPKTKRCVLKTGKIGKQILKNRA